jgi:hypothetical protein
MMHDGSSERGRERSKESMHCRGVEPGSAGTSLLCMTSTNDSARTVRHMRQSMLRHDVRRTTEEP